MSGISGALRFAVQGHGSRVAMAALLAGAMAPSMGANAVGRTITVTSGTFGENCGAVHGNATRDLASQCDGRANCEYQLDAVALRAHAGQCGNNLVAEWRCTDTEFHTASLSAVAAPGDTLVLSCVWQTGPGH